jgi:large subunit ribosomal protein L25
VATKEFKLEVERRQKVGTTGSQALRAAGKLPAVLYGHGVVPEHLALEAHAFEELIHHAGRNAIITLTEGSRKGQTALVREIQRHPVSRRILHADLQRVSADETIAAMLPVVTVGVAEGVRNAGAVMDVITHEIEVAGPANRIPEHLEVDVTELGIHDHVTAGEIALPADFKLLTAPETVVVAIEPSRTARELEEAAAPGEQPAEPEVIGAAEPAAAPEAQ